MERKGSVSAASQLSRGSSPQTWPGRQPSSGSFTVQGASIAVSSTPACGSAPAPGWPGHCSLGGQVCAWAPLPAQARAAHRPAARGRGSIAGGGVALPPLRAMVGGAGGAVVLPPLRAIVGGAGAARQGHHGAIMEGVTARGAAKSPPCTEIDQIEIACAHAQCGEAT